MNWIWVFIGGGAGSLLRYLISLVTPHLVKTNFPLATFISNVLACILLGVIVFFLQKEHKSEFLNHLLVIGFCGGFSTFSTFSMENFRLLNEGHWPVMILNIVLSVAIGIIAIVLLSLNRN